SKANALLAESVGKSESALFLNVPTNPLQAPNTSTRSQGVIVTGSFNFANQPQAPSESESGVKIVTYVSPDGVTFYDADGPTGPNVTAGSTLTFKYVVTNTGADPIASIIVTDDKLGTITGPLSGDTHNIGLLDVDETWTYTKTAVALADQQFDRGTVQGT